MYVKVSNEYKQIILCLYVDDLLVTRSNEVKLTRFKAKMKNEFKLCNMCNFVYLLEMEFVNTKDGVFFIRRNMQKT